MSNSGGDPPQPPAVHIEYQEAEGREAAPAKPVLAPRNSNLSSAALFDLVDGDHPVGQRESSLVLRHRLTWSLILVVIGVALIVVGFVVEETAVSPAGGVPFWVIGVMVLVPGMYCVWDAGVTIRQQQKTDREKILKEDEGKDEQGSSQLQ